MRFAGTQISNFMDNDSFDNISKTAAKSRSQERMAYDQSEGLVDQADINAEATIQAAKYGASATRAQGAAAGQSSMFAGLGSMASGIAGGLANRGLPDTGTNTNNPLGTLTDPTADIQRALGPGVKFGMYR